jgi:hypothetical protein
MMRLTVWGPSESRDLKVGEVRDVQALGLNLAVFRSVSFCHTYISRKQSMYTVKEIRKVF